MPAGTLTEKFPSASVVVVAVVGPVTVTAAFGTEAPV